MYLDSNNAAIGKTTRHSAFTLVEVLVAATLIGLMAASAIWALMQANTYASISRLYTGAETAAQNQIDLILTDGPFNPQLGQIPPELTLGTSAPQTVTVYSEPNPAHGLPLIVTGQMITTVRDTAIINNGNNLNVYSATVVVTYRYRNKTYSVQLNALRASDV